MRAWLPALVAGGCAGVVILASVALGVPHSPKPAVYTTTSPTCGILPTMGFPPTIGIDPASHTVFAAVSGVSGEVLALNESTGVLKSTLRTGSPVSGLAVDPVQHHLYVAEAASGNVTVYDSRTLTLLARIAVPADPTSIAIDTRDSGVFVWYANLGSVTILDGINLTVTGSIAVGPQLIGDPTSAMVYDPLTNDLYLGNGTSLVLFNASSGAFLRSIPLGYAAYPASMVLNGSGGWIYVALSGSQRVDVVNATSARIVKTWAFGSGGWLGNRIEPTLLAFEPQSGELLVGAYGTTNISVLNGTTGAAVRAVDYPTKPTGLGLDPATDLMFVSLAGQSETAVVDTRTWAPIVAAHPAGTYAVSFQETGLPTGTLWAISLSTAPGPPSVCSLWTMGGTSGSNVTFYSTNGTFPYSLSPYAFPPGYSPERDGYSPDVTLGNVTIAGSPVEVGVGFSRSPAGFHVPLGWLPPVLYLAGMGSVGLVAGVVSLSLLHRRTSGRS